MEVFGLLQEIKPMTDQREWLHQLMAISQIVYPNLMAEILLRRLDKLQELDVQGNMTEAEADTAADADEVAGPAAKLYNAFAAETGMRDSHNSRQRQDKGVSHASRMSHPATAGSKGSTSSAAASSGNQAGMLD